MKVKFISKAVHLNERISEFRELLRPYLTDRRKKLGEVAEEVKEAGHEFVRYYKNPDRLDENDLHYISSVVVDDIDTEIKLREFVVDFSNDGIDVLEEIEDGEENVNLEKKLFFIDDLSDALDFSPNSNLEDLDYLLEESQTLLASLIEHLNKSNLLH